MAEALDTPLRVISFVGGGCRAQSSLHILNRVMKEIAIETGQEGKDLRPCDYFQLMGGTSAGGILAIMLGRLGMTVPQCIVAFRGLAEKVFKHGKRFPWIMTVRYKSEYVVAAVKEVLRQWGWEEEEQLLVGGSPPNNHCRTFVTALDRRRVTGNKEPIIFRTYPAPCSDPELQETVDSATIWQAIRATTAAPTYFEPLILRGVGFLDAAAGGFNDPGLVVRGQAAKIWPDRKIDVFLSLGTGQHIQRGLMHTNFIFLGFDLLRALMRILTSNEVITHQIETELGQDVFFHFNVDNGFGDINIANWRMLKNFEILTNKYLESVESIEKIKSLVQKVVKPRPIEARNDKEPIALKIPASASETDFPYTAQNLPSLYRRIIRGFKSHSNCVESYNEMLSHIKSDKLFDASTFQGCWKRSFEYSKKYLGEAVAGLEVEYRERQKDEVFVEATALKSKLHQLFKDVKSFQPMDLDETNRLSGEMLEKCLFGRSITNPNPYDIHYGPTRVHTLQRTRTSTWQPCR